ncbi:MAG: mRNA-degrading endonuclease [Anaerolineae bacterium]|jgi:mRNA interferase MazF|nr:mRNA-degrading endonuclease [Anaerolineae bacterium]
MEIPKRGDLIKLDFDNTTGHEQAGYRRALVISPEIYNRKVGLAVVCSITNQQKGYPFEVEIPTGLKVTGVILSDQVRTIDWNARKVQIVDHVPPECISEVQEKISKLIL